LSLRNLSGRKGEPWHQLESGDLLRNVVYGFNDGLTANFGLVAGVLGANVDAHIVILSGLAGTIADALSMGASGYLAAKSEQEVHDHEIAMEREEIRLMPELEREELALIYQAKGMDREAAESLARTLMENPDRALKEMIREELRIGEQHSTPMREAWITGIATAFGAFIPVAPFMIFSNLVVAAWVSFAIAMLSHFAVGAARSLFTGRGLMRSGFDMFAVGLGVAIVGYFFGYLITGVMP
jgi:VIT1/CCC1 family predicted Fe2+/Mn2+ transporter